MKPSRRAITLAIWIACLCLGAGGALATVTIRDNTLDDLTRESTDIVRARVLEIGSRWNAERTLIVTDIRLAVERSFKGAAGGEITLSLHGGRVDDLVLEVLGTPAFAVGDDVLLFLDQRGKSSYALPALYQGKYEIGGPAGDARIGSREYSLARLIPERAGELDEAGRLGWESFAEELERTVRRTRGGAR